MRGLPGIFVSADWLADHLGDVVVADVRWRLGTGALRDEHVSGHIPGAVFVDLDRDLSGPPGGAAGRHPLPDARSFAATLGRLGIGPEDPVVAYDDAAGVVAARLVWMLRTLGQAAAVLDGGLAAWDGPLERGDTRREPRAVPVRPWPAGAVIDADAVAAAAAGGVPVLDARSPDRYRGDHEPVDARAGHIPGARNLPTGDLLGPDGRLADPEDLRRRFGAVGVTERTTTWVSSCGSGVTACFDLLAAEAAGLPAGRLFAASWSGWAAEPHRPAATGPDPWGER